MLHQSRGFSLIGLIAVIPLIAMMTIWIYSAIKKDAEYKYANAESNMLYQIAYSTGLYMNHMINEGEDICLGCNYDYSALELLINSYLPPSFTYNPKFYDKPQFVLIFEENYSEEINEFYYNARIDFGPFKDGVFDGERADIMGIILRQFEAIHNDPMIGLSLEFDNSNGPHHAIFNVNINPNGDPGNNPNGQWIAVDNTNPPTDSISWSNNDLYDVGNLVTNNIFINEAACIQHLGAGSGGFLRHFIIYDYGELALPSMLPPNNGNNNILNVPLPACFGPDTPEIQLQLTSLDIGNTQSSINTETESTFNAVSNWKLLSEINNQVPDVFNIELIVTMQDGSTLNFDGTDNASATINYQTFCRPSSLENAMCFPFSDYDTRVYDEVIYDEDFPEFCSASPYTSDLCFVTGEYIEHRGLLYICKDANWCNTVNFDYNQYEPGNNLPEQVWTSAWDQIFGQ